MNKRNNNNNNTRWKLRAQSTWLLLPNRTVGLQTLQGLQWLPATATSGTEAKVHSFPSPEYWEE